MKKEANRGDEREAEEGKEGEEVKEGEREEGDGDIRRNGGDRGIIDTRVYLRQRTSHTGGGGGGGGD